MMCDIGRVGDVFYLLFFFVIEIDRAQREYKVIWLVKDLRPHPVYSLIRNTLKVFDWLQHKSSG